MNEAFLNGLLIKCAARWRTYFVITSVLAALFFQLVIAQIYFGPSEHKVAEIVPRDDENPGTVHFGNPHSKVYVTVWLAPDCHYCRTWWADNASTYQDKNGPAELVVRELPESDRDIYVAQFLACLPTNSLRQAALVQFMVKDDWMSAPIGAWPRVEHENTVCLANEKLKQTMLAKIKADVNSYGLVGTPTFAIGNTLVRGDIRSVVANR